jgi:hypothetical protein
VNHKSIPSSEDGKKKLAQDLMRMEIDRLGLTPSVSHRLDEIYMQYGTISIDKLSLILTNIKNDFVGVPGYNGC